MTSYYNEIDPFAAAWLRELIKAGAVAPGDVDERDIRDVKPDDLKGYTQCHFFAGIGVWSYALRQAGWDDDRSVWTGSCPCQPFSAAGKRGGNADERHLWPHWHHLIRECSPAIVLGEQVASKDGLNWFDLVSADLEGEDYAVGASDLCAAGVGAPHIRQRLFFVGLANTDDEGSQGWGEPRRERAAECAAGARGMVGRVADTDGGHARAERKQPGRQHGQQSQDGGAGGMADSPTSGRVEERADNGRLAVGDREEGRPTGSGASSRDQRPGPTNGFWRDADWLGCRDGRWRPVEPGSFPLVHGASNRVGRLRGYGNAIVAPVAQTFIESVMDTLPE